jgi:hypothetical protein
MGLAPIQVGCIGLLFGRIRSPVGLIRVGFGLIGPSVGGISALSVAISLDSGSLCARHQPGDSSQHRVAVLLPDVLQDILANICRESFSGDEHADVSLVVSLPSPLRVTAHEAGCRGSAGMPGVRQLCQRQPLAVLDVLHLPGLLDADGP